MLTLCNTSPLPSEPMGDLSYLDFIVLNDIEARVLCGLPEDSDKPYEQMLRQIRDEYHTRGVIMTCGEDGSAVLDGEEFWTVAPTPVKAVDTIGAGDGIWRRWPPAGMGQEPEGGHPVGQQVRGLQGHPQRQHDRKPGMGYPELAEVEAFMEAHP